MPAGLSTQDVLNIVLWAGGLLVYVILTVRGWPRGPKDDGKGRDEAAA